MLTARPKSFGSKIFLIYDEGKLVTELELSKFPKRVSFSFHGKKFSVLRKKRFHCEFILISEGQKLATAEIIVIQLLPNFRLTELEKK